MTEASATACFLFYYFAAAVTETDAAETMADAAAAATLSGCCSSFPAADAAVDLVSAVTETAAAVVNDHSF